MTLQDEVEKVIAENIVVDASGLSPAVVSAFVHGHKQAAQAAIAAVLRAMEKTYEVWQDDMLVASSTSPTDGLHYARVYEQDGEAEVSTVFSLRMKGVRSAFASEHDVEIG